MPDALKIAQYAADAIYAHDGLKVNPELFLAQMRHETGNFSTIDDDLAAAHNWAGMSTDKPTSLPRPAKEGGFYKEYDSDEEFAADWANNFKLYADYWLEHGGSSEINDPDTFVDFLIADPNAKYFTDNPDTYKASLAGLMGGSYTDLLSHKGPWGTKGAYNLTDPKEEPQQPSFLDEIHDKFLASFYDNGVTSVIRTAYANFLGASAFNEIPLFNNYTPSAVDVKLVQDTLKDDPIAQNYVLSMATNREALLHLLENKKEDIARQEAVDNMDYGFSSLATVTGAVLDPTLLLALVPGLGEAVGGAKIVNLMSRVGKVRAALSMGNRALNASKAARFAARALTTSVGVGAERWMAQEYGGFQPNYAASMTLGALVGGLSTVIGRTKKLGANKEYIRDLERTKDAIEDNTAAIATGAVPPAEVKFNLKANLATEMKKAFEDVQQKTPLPDLVKPGSTTEKLVQNGSVFIIPEKAARGIAAKFGVEIAEDAKAFSIPRMGISVIMKEKVDKGNIDGVVAHEVAVHQSLKEFLGDEKYEQLMSVVSERMRNSKDSRWVTAARNADSPEEALAYYIEQGASKKQGVVKSLINAFASRLSTDGKVDKQLRDTVYEILQRRAKETLAEKEIALKLPDGSHIVGDVHYSKQNIFGTLFDEVSDAGKHAKELQEFSEHPWLQKLFTPFGLFFDHSTLTGSFYGIMANSHSPLMQEMARKLVGDARMRAKDTTTLDASTIKKNLYDRFIQQYYDFAKARTIYINKTFGAIPGRVRRNHYIKAVNEQIILCHDALKRGDNVTARAFGPEIMKLAGMQSDLRSDMVRLLKKNSEELGGEEGFGSLIEKDWEAVSDAFYRVTDDDKRLQWETHNFKNRAESEEFLKNYALHFMDKDAEFRFYLNKHKKEWDAEVEKWEKSGQEGPKPMYTTPKPDDAEVQEFFEKEAANWAKGMVDRNRSLLKFDKTEAESAIKPFKHRVAIDTSGVLKMPNGIEFSYDKDLRNFDMDAYVPQIMNRLTGEAALHAVLGDKKAREDAFNAIAQQLAKNDIRNATGKREEEALKLCLDKILGRGNYDEYDRRWGQALSNAVRNLSYALVGGNMGFNQLGELLGMAAYGGFKAVANSLPDSMMKAIRNQRLGKTPGEVIDRVSHSIFAEELTYRASDLSSSTDSRIFREINDKNGSLSSMALRGLDEMNKAIKRADMVTNMCNFLPRLTNAMVMAMKKAAIEDTLYWAEGKEVGSFWRKPFSKKKWAAIGVHSDEEIARIRAATKKWLIDEKGDIDRWADEDPDTFNLWKNFVDNESYRGIQQQTIGNQNPFKDQHKIIFQYKDFTLGAINGQFMRALQSWEADDLAAFIFSYFSNMGAYYAITYAKAMAKYPYAEDADKRQKYMDDQANWGRLCAAGFMRMSMLAPLSFASDAFESFTGYSMFRTTVDNSNNADKTFMESMSELNPFSKTPSTRSYSDKIGQVIKQFPAVNSGLNFGAGIVSAGRLLRGVGNQDDINIAVTGTPMLGSHIGALGLVSFAKHNSMLPTKEEQQKQAQKEKKKLDKLLSIKNKKVKTTDKTKKKVDKILYKKEK